MKLTRMEVSGHGIYAAVERHCPRDDIRRKGKPDGSWLPKVGSQYPGSISFWKSKGLDKYISSGLFSWHQSVVEGTVEIKEFNAKEIQVVYEDELQVIGTLRDGRP